MAAAVAAVAVLLLVGSCASEQGEAPGAVTASAGVSPPVVAAPPGAAWLDLVPARFTDLPGWTRDRHSEALWSLRRSCPKLAAKPDGQPLGGSPLFGTTGQWRRICAAADRVGAGDAAARTFFETWFVPFRASNGGDERGLFTGYYEPVLRGSWRRTPRHRTPIYRAPPELASANARVHGRGVTLPSRSQIDAGALAGRNLELLWVDDPVDAFFLHIQGSGLVEMDDGSRVRVGYAGKNGHAYVAIGAELIRRGEIAREQMSMQAIRAWLAANPAEAPALMASNGSYVFFRLVDGDGPIGAQGVPLTAGRSIAVDPAFVPYGVPAWIDTTDPLRPELPLRRLVVAQDTGGAIKGPVRGDLFWGSGDLAGAAAGPMKQDGRWFLLVPRAAAATS